MSRRLAFVLLAFSASSLRAQVALPVPPPLPAKRAKPIPGDQPDKAAEFYVMKRAGTGARDLPYEKYVAAQQRVAKMRGYSLSQKSFITPRKGNAAAMDLGGWEALGPGNQGGRTRHLLIHPANPQVMYAGAATGGVWKTVDGGDNWTPISDSFPALGIGGMAFEPGNPDTLYAGTGFWFNALSTTNVLGSAPRGAGIFRSRDAGATWEQLPQPAGLHFRYINEILISRHDVNRIYVATWTGIFRSVDAGRTWAQVVDRSASAQNGCQDMVMRQDQGTDYLFAACGTTPTSSPAILRHMDAAADTPWQVVFTNAAMGNTTLAIAPSSPDTVYALLASNGADRVEWRNSLLGVWRSTSSGEPDTWEMRVGNQDSLAVNTGLLSQNQGFYNHICGTQARTIGGQGWIHNAIAVDPQDPDRVYVGGIDIYRSDDGGKNWGIASFWQSADGPGGAHADVLGLVFPPDFDGSARPYLYAVTDGGVYLTLNARDALAAGERAGCAMTNRVRWLPLHGGYQTTQFYSGAVLPGGGAFFGGKQDNGTMRGTLASKSDWLRLRGGDGAAVAVDPRDPNRIFVSIQNFGLNKSVDGGLTLAGAMRGIAEPAANFSFVAPLAMDQANPDRLYAGARIFYRTEDQAGQWVAISTELPAAAGMVSAIAVAPSDSTRVIFATSTGFLYRTGNALEADASTEWQSVRPRPGYVPAVTFDPQNADVVYAVYSQFHTAAGQSHVYRSTDGGRTWSGIDGEGDNGVPDIPVLAVTVDPQDARRIYLGTDLGVFVSVDGGGCWARDQNPFAAVPAEALVLERGAGATYLYAFTFGRGVWRTLLPGTGSPCQYTLGALPTSLPAFGATVDVPVQAGDGCAWSAVARAGALEVLSPASGRGPGNARVRVAWNTTATTRPLSIGVQDKIGASRQAAPFFVPATADVFATPVSVPALPYLSIADSRGFTAEEGDKKASCSGIAPAKTMWHRLTTPASGTLEVSFEGRRYDVFGSSGMVVTAFAASDGERGDELACGTLPRNTGSWLTGRLRFPVQAGSTYYMQVGATGTAATDGGFTLLGLQMLP